jgi:hypothetical protein
MKFKVLRKKDTKEYMHICNWSGSLWVFTSKTPTLLSVSDTMNMEELKEYYEKHSASECEIDFSNLELIDVELIELTK